MNEIEFRFIPLTFISSQEEIEKQIKNTIVLRYVLEKYKDLRKLGTLLESTQYGYTASAKSDGNCRFLRITDIQDGNVNWEAVPFCDCIEKETYILRQNDFLVARTGGTTGKSYIITEKIDDTIFASYLIRLRAKKELDHSYLYMFLNSYTYWSQITQLKRGSAQPNVNAQKLRELIIPYCPTDEQIRIVSLLNSDSLAYDDKLKDEMDDAIEKFHLNLELSNLIDKQLVLVNKLRQAILQEAVQGKLVPQDPDDEPAPVLLEKIKAEKEKLIQGKNKEKALPPIKEDEIPYDLPKGWEWERLGKVTLIILGQSPPSITYNTNKEGLPFYQGKADFGKLHPIPTQWCSAPEKIAEKNDILISVRAPVGPTNICNDKSCIGRGLAAIRMLNEMSNFYILYLLKAFEESISGKGSGTTFPAITGNDLSRILIPIPPINEQKRIVEKVNELMKLCDELESQLAQSKQESEKLMQAVLQEAFQGAV